MFRKKLLIFGIISVSMLSLAACGDTSSSKNNSEIKVSNDKPYELAKDLMTNKRMYFSIRNDNSMIGKDSIVDDVFVIDHGNITDYDLTDYNYNSNDEGVKLKDLKGLSDNQIEKKVSDIVKDFYFSDKRIQKYKDSVENFINSADDANKYAQKPNDEKDPIGHDTGYDWYSKNDVAKMVELGKKDLDLVKSINSKNISKYIGYKGKIFVSGETDSSGNNLQTELLNAKLKNNAPTYFFDNKFGVESTIRGFIGYDGSDKTDSFSSIGKSFESDLTLTIPTPIHGMTSTVYNDKYYSLGTNDSDILVTKLSNKDNIPMEDQLDSKYIKVKD